jgi:hypothetical protein
VGYLEDGTMIVVEDGEKLMGKDVKVEVSKIFQSVAGKMIFASQQGNGGSTRQTASKRPNSQHRGNHNRSRNQK